MVSKHELGRDCRAEGHAAIRAQDQGLCSHVRSIAVLLDGCVAVTWTTTTADHMQGELDTSNFDTYEEAALPKTSVMKFPAEFKDF